MGNQEINQGKGIGTRGIEPGLGNQEIKQGKGIGTRGIEPGLGNQKIKQGKGIGTRGIEPEMEFKEFEPRFKSAKTRFKLSAGLNLETFDTISSGTNHI